MRAASGGMLTTRKRLSCHCHQGCLYFFFFFFFFFFPQPWRCS
ncbi:hypothetical protein ACPA9J_31185 [Pseudomonas aeruginosa]